jgi:hypothetical protein
LVTFFFVAGFFLLTVFLRLTDFLATAFFLAAFFFATGFFALTFLAAAFFLETGAFFRFLLVAFLTAILNSCQIEKRAGLYIACADMEAYFFEDFFGRMNWPESRVGHGTEPIVFF